MTSYSNMSRFRAAALSATAALALTVSAQEAVQDPAGVTVTLDKASKTYTIDWPEEIGTDLFLEVSSSPDTPAGEGQLLVRKPQASKYEWTAETLDARHYFTLVPATGEPVRTALRLLPLEGGRNFRDLGGYVTDSGKTVRWGHLYRSGVMSELTDEDYVYLSELGIQVICDLRTAQERAEEPTNWKGSDIEYITFPDPASDDAMGLMAVFQDPDVTPEMVSQTMANAYASIAEDQTPAYREMFDRLAGGEVPLAFNCSAGKDRTGIGAALLLTALGVPRETVVADYALSEVYVDYIEAFAGDEAALEEDSPYAFLAKLPPELVTPLMRSDPFYIETALADLEAEYGSVMAFLKEEVDVTDEELTAIRSALLQ